jgi:gas vesicle protein
MQLGELWVGLLGAVVGAIVGGAATLFASLIVERKKVVRETRIRLYGKLLPAVVDGF